MRLAVDLSAVVWNTLLAGNDPEGHDVEFNGRKWHINTVGYGYENVVNSLIAYMREAQAQPLDMILVAEGTNSKGPRLMIFEGYKQGRERPEEYYPVFQQVRDQVIDTFRSLGAIAVVQDNCEADDTLAWLAAHTRKPMMIATVDNDMAVLNGTNSHGAAIVVSVAHVQGDNKFGMFPHKFITLYKAMVGDQGDKISGIKGFGPGKWMDFHAEFGEAGMQELVRLAELGSLSELAEEADKNKMIGRIYGGRDDFLRSYRLAKLHPEWVNGPTDPLRWMPGFPQPTARSDERLRPYAAQMRLVTAENYDAALAFLKSQAPASPFYGVDLETSTPPESDDWLIAREANGKKVDVIASTITGASISFGANMQYSYYISVDHTDTANVTMDQLVAMLSVLDPAKVSAAHNAQGFELPVMYMNFGDKIKANGWRGFFPNMVDTRIAATHWDENQFNFGLKDLSHKLFGYSQVTYDEVTGGAKMNEIPASQVLEYGCDDSYTAGGLWVFFSLFMELEGTFPDFMRNEQKPMYLQALAYCQGVNMDAGKLRKLTQADKELEARLRADLDKFLIGLGWEGSFAPVVGPSTMSPQLIKDIYKIVCGEELKTMVRTPGKFPELIRATGKKGSELVAACLEEAIKDEKYESLTQLVHQNFKANPEFNLGSPKQLQHLLYERLGMPVRLRNKPTTAMKAAGQKEGQARTDEDAIKLGLNLGDVDDQFTREVLKALIELKSINTRTSLYWDAYPGMIHWQTGKLHPSLKQSGTNTRRWSASDPNVQQMEGTYGAVRSVLLPHHRNAVVVSLDESAQELRQLADYCLDPTMLTCYLGSKDQLRDIHSIVGAKIADVTYEEFRKRYKIEEAEARLPDEQKTYPTLFLHIRQRAKITIFSLVYGAGAAKIGETLSISQEDAQSYIDTIFEMFPGIVAWREETERKAKELGYVEIHGGGVRHLAPLMNSEDRFIAAKALRQAGNSRIQGSGANQIKRVMTRIWDSNLLDDYDYRWMMSVHDESVHSIGKDDVAAVLPILHGFMTEQYLKVVPSASSIGIGTSFGTLTEIGEQFDLEKVNKVLNDIFHKEEVAA